MTKQEKIKEAWVNQVGDKRYNALKEELVLDGFLFYQPSDLIEVDTKIIDGLPFYRPKSLKGIENNNGWLKIESEDDLPKKITDVIIIKDDGEMYVTKFYPKTFKGWVNAFTIDHIVGLGYKSVTYYQPIVIPKPPIY